MSVGPGGSRPVDASMSLLTDLINRPEEPGYAMAAAAGEPELPPARRVARTSLLLLLAIALGLVTAVAVASLRVPQPAQNQAPALLEREIEERGRQADALIAGNELLDSEIRGLQASALEADDPGFFERLAAVEMASGAVAVTGPGLVLTITDAPEAATTGDARFRVQDVDLQVVTNSLWAAGAEAIAVNGHRLTALSAIRSAGQAILVDLAPLVGPYRIEAIGDVRELQTEFARSRAAGHLATLSGTYGISTETTSSQELVLGGSGITSLAHAVTPGVASSSPTSGGGP